MMQCMECNTKDFFRVSGASQEQQRVGVAMDQLMEWLFAPPEGFDFILQVRCS